MRGSAIRIIGIDPGLRRTGWGVVESDGVRLSYVASGVVTAPVDADLAYRLRELFEGLTSVIASFKPHEAAVEETFVNDNARATLKLGQARGMALLAPAMGGLAVSEYPPNLIKKTVVGAGHADKHQVQTMIGFLLPKARCNSADEADALAIAICHANHRQARARLGAVQRGGRQEVVERRPAYVTADAVQCRERSMIGKLKGKVDAIGESFLIVDVGGVGYEVQASSRTLRDMKAGDEVSLTIDTHVREDAIRLFGFASEVERSWFRTLQSVQGVGAKVALGLLGTLSPRELANAIALSDWALVEEAPGIGKKLAQRIVAELKDKAPALAVGVLNGAGVRDGCLCIAARGQRRCRGALGTDQSRLQPGASVGSDCRRVEGAGCRRRYGKAHPPRVERAGAVVNALKRCAAFSSSSRATKSQVVTFLVSTISPRNGDCGHEMVACIVDLRICAGGRRGRGANQYRHAHLHAGGDR